MPRLIRGQRVVALAKPIKVPDIIDRETELKPQQLRQYFERIELPEQLRNERRLGRLDSELLSAIVKGHVTHIPFENLSLVPRPSFSCALLKGMDKQAMMQGQQHPACRNPSFATRQIGC